MEYTIEKIKRDLKVETILLIITCILSLIVCFGNMELEKQNEDLKQEKEAYEDLVEMQNSMIADLEENCRDLYIELENLKSGGNVE